MSDGIIIEDETEEGPSASKSKETVQAEIGEVDILLESVNSELERLNRRKQKLLSRKMKLKEDLRELDMEKIRKADWKSKSFEWSDRMDSILKTTFNLSHYRPLQLEAMNSFLSGHDVMLTMPTGGGKSLCYQLPALAHPKKHSLTLVVSPLVSLIEDQIISLKKLNVEAETLTSSSTKETVSRVHKMMTDPNCPLKLLYVTPEKIAKSKMFMNKLQKAYELGTFVQIAIDEVHCCSHWGHDFRPDYKYLAVFKQVFPKLPIIGLTATMTSDVAKDVQKILNTHNSLNFRAPFNRPNLFYEVRQKPESAEEMVDDLCDLLTKKFAGQSGIIYTLTIKDAETLCRQLVERNVKVMAYHASLDRDRRSKVHKKWLQGSCQAVVATIAFGMGIDKPNVRFVIHHSMSKSMENFYQESGRAGRDDLESWCILYYRLADLSRISTMVFVENTGLSKLYGILAYCLDGRRCRREMISQHFEESWENSHCEKMCDHCKSSTQESHERDVTFYAEACLEILRLAKNKGDKVTSLKLLNSLLNSGSHKLKNWKYSKNDFNRAIGERLIAHMIIRGHLKEDFHFTPYTTLSYVAQGDAPLPSAPFKIDILSVELP